MKNIIITLLCLLVYTYNYAVPTSQLTISAGSNWQDAVLYQDTRPGYEHLSNNNYKDDLRLSAVAWTHSGKPIYRRSLIRFNLNQLPANAVIQSAVLYFYSDPTVISSSSAIGNSQLSGSNAFFIEKVTGAWNESTVSWNNQPATTTQDRIWVGPSTSTTENRQIPITGFVQDWISDPSQNHGIKMILENEAYWRSRNYASTNHPNASIRPKLVITYSVSSDPVASRLDYIFARLDKAQVPSGFLEEYGAEIVPMDTYNGVLSDSNRFDLTTWRMAYASYQSSRIHGTNPLPGISSINQQISNLQSSGVNPVMVAYGDYGIMKENAVTDNLLRIENDQLVDVAGRPASPYLARTVFMATPAKNYTANGNVSFIFKPETFYNTSGKSVANLYVDFADGRGYINASWNSPISANYSSTGLKRLKIKVRFTDNSTVECYTDLEVQNPSTVAARYINLPDHVEPFAAGDHSGGQAFVVLDVNDTDGIIDKPLIVVEGYDISSIAPRLQENYDLGEFIEDLDDAFPFQFNDALDDVAGYDLIFLDYANGTDDIRRNAELLEDVITWVNGEKLRAGSAEQNVILGISMGGLVARYALAEMTKAGMATQTRLLVTHDSPHRGANTPLGIQALTRAVNEVLLVRAINWLDLIPELEQAEAVLDAPATQQLLILRATNGTGGFATNNFLDGEYRNVITFSGSDPQPTYQVIATSLGAECGESPLAPASNLVDVQGRFFISPLPWIKRTSYNTEIKVNALPNQGSSIQMSKLRLWKEKRFFMLIKVNINLTNRTANSPANVLPWDSAPGGTQSVATQVGNRFPTTNFKILWFMEASLNGTFADDFCFVPTVSAIDVTVINNTTLFANYTWGLSPGNNARTDAFITHEWAAGNQFNESHPRFTAENAQWMFNEMELLNNNLACSGNCNPGGYSVSGAPSICTEETYTISEIPPGYVINWSRSSNLTYVSGQGTANYTVSASLGASGATWVEATLTGDCGSIIRRINISLEGSGIPYDDIVIVGPDQVCPYENYFYYAENNSSIPVEEWRWTLPYNWNKFYQFDDSYISEIGIYTDNFSGSDAIYLEIRTACGGWQEGFEFYVQEDYWCSFQYSVYPNPAEEFLDVSVNSTSKQSANKITGSELTNDNVQNENQIISLRLYNDKSILVKSEEFEYPSTRINTIDLAPGRYVLHVIKAEGIDKRHIIIK